MGNFVEKMLSKLQYYFIRISRQRKLLYEKKQGIEYFRECADKYGDMQMEEINRKMNESFQIVDGVLDMKDPVDMPQLTHIQLQMVNDAFTGDPNEVITEKFSLSIKRRDLLTLADLNWLNDEIINFYMNMIIERGENPKWPKAYAFNTFFYPKLLRDGYHSLRRWTKKIDIFANALICIPIHLGFHWCMAIIDLRAKYIRYYDSTGNSNNRCLKALKKYLEDEHLDKKKCPLYTTDFKLENLKDIPQQSNGNDCGIFTCTYAEFITRDAKIGFDQEHIPYLRKKMAVEVLAGELLVK
ncbi:sentrin-specific protease 1-like [Diorhabda carinulata]|uniref:sentrin-specific protease 1-like n=1 Tax=Diorhabda carinulata TaxID=1163345 RepID=UPI0025A157C7|nr:sentrin-specific protease 1-like [Diorhabda carinulata]